MATFVLVNLASSEVAEDARRDIESEGVFVEAFEYDPATRCMTITTPTDMLTCQRAAMNYGYRPHHVTLRGNLWRRHGVA